MFDALGSPRELSSRTSWGAALTMEKVVLSMLGELETATQRDQLKQQFRHHAQETEQQIRNLEQAFQALGVEDDEKPCPAIEGIEKEGQTLIKKADEGLVDAVILGGAADTEHHEISVYEGLITKAEAMGEEDFVALLAGEPRAEEAHAEDVKKASQQLAQELARQVA